MFLIADAKTVSWIANCQNPSATDSPLLEAARTMFLHEANAGGIAIGEPNSPASERILSHLRNEEQSLQRMLDAVRKLNQSLLKMNNDQIAAALDDESAALKDALEMQTRREQFRSEIGKLIGVSQDQLTMDALAEKSEGRVRDAVKSSRERLKAMAAELHSLNRQNAAMLRQGLILIRNIFGKLTNSPGLGESYTSGGAREDSGVGTLMQWGG